MKKLFILLFAICCLLVASSPVSAEDIQQKFIEAITGDGYNRQKHDLGVTGDLMNTIIVAIGGMPTENPDGTGYKREGGAIAIISDLTTTLYSTQPASSVEYLADVAGNLGLAKPAYAQGMGWTAFSPVLGLWKIFRNIAYLCFVIIFVVIGFMIMFRTKINPQTVIGIQNALPRIIVTLLLITFSYAIAGFIVDIGQLSTRIIGNTLGQQGLFSLTGAHFDPTKLNTLLSTDIFRLINPLRDPSRIAAEIADIEIGPTAILPGWLAEITVTAIFWLAGFFIMFKIFFALIGPYIGIVLSVIFAPFQLLFGAFPGVNSVGGWLKGLFANVMVFPVTFAMLAIAAILRGPSSASGADWGVPAGQPGISWAPTTIGTWGGAVPHLLAFGILFTIPQVAKITRSVIEGKGVPPEAGEGIKEEIRGAVGRIPVVKSFVKI